MSLPPHRRSRKAIAGARRQDGQSLVFTAAILTMLLALVAITVDLGSLYVSQRHAQTAADAGSLAAAENLPLPSNVTAAASDATEYGHTLNDPTASVTTNAAPVGGSAACTSPSYNSLTPNAWAACFEAQVGVSQSQPLSFERLFGNTTGTVSASAISTVNLTPSASGGNLVSNFNFPTGCTLPNGNPQPDPTFCEPGVAGSSSALSGGTTIGRSGTPWTVIFGNVDWAADGAKYVNYVEPPGYSGANVIDMNGNQDGGIAQTITGLVTGKKYLLSFLLSGNAGHSEPSFTMTVAIGGQLTVKTANPPATPTVTCPTTPATVCIPFTHTDVNPSVMTWETVGIPFTATSTSTTISFVSTSSQSDDDNDNTGPTLAQVGVQPATFSLAQ